MAPVIIELNATINLHHGSFEQATITLEISSERAEIPVVDDLKAGCF